MPASRISSSSASFQVAPAPPTVPPPVPLSLDSFLARAKRRLVVSHRRVKLDKAIAALEPRWPGEGYDLIRRNCAHFCDDVCAALGYAEEGDAPTCKSSIGS